MKNLNEFSTERLKTPSKSIAVVLVSFLAFVLAAFVLNPFVIVKAGHRGVVLNFGAVSKNVLDEGLHIRIPIVQKVVQMDVRVQKEQTHAESASKDLQDIKTTIAVNYHILPDKANKIYQEIGQEYRARIIDPAVQEVVKAVTANFTASELITQREKVRNEIKELLKQRLITYNIVVDDFSIVNFAFSQQFTQAIEAKQTAEQLAQKAQRDLERVKIEAQQKITQAEAEARALALQKQNITPDLVRLREIEARLKAIEKWDGHMPKVVGGAVPFIGIEDTEKAKK